MYAAQNGRFVGKRNVYGAVYTITRQGVLVMYPNRLKYESGSEFSPELEARRETWLYSWPMARPSGDRAQLRCSTQLAQGYHCQQQRQRITNPSLTSRIGDLAEDFVQVLGRLLQSFTRFWCRVYVRSSLGVVGLAPKQLTQERPSSRLCNSPGVLIGSAGVLWFGDEWPVYRERLRGKASSD